MTQGDTQEHQDSASEGFHSSGSDAGDQGTPNPAPVNAAQGGQPAVTAPAPQGGAGPPPSAATTNPARPTLLDITTPEGMRAARDFLNRVVAVSGQPGAQPAGPTWASVGPGPASPSSSSVGTTGASSSTAPPVAGGGFFPLANGVPTSTAPTTSAGTGVPSATTGSATGGNGWGVAYSAPPAGPNAPAWAGVPTATNPAPTPSTAVGSIPAPTPASTSRLRSAIASYGGVLLQGTPTQGGYGFSPVGMPSSSAVAGSVSAPGMVATQPVYGGTTPAGQGAQVPLVAGVSSTYYGGMPSHIKNAVRMIQPFHSDNATLDKAKIFWDSFVRATAGLNEQLRISAFRECLKGKKAEEWWMYSRIDSFETLRIRFHNEFICLSPLQLIERLKSTKRSRGMSAEVWGDLVQSLCDEAQCFDPQMRYQYFLSGLRNREWKAALSSSMVDNIHHAVLVLLQRGMHIPVEDDADFTDEKTSDKKSEDSTLKDMMRLLQQNQNLILRQQAEIARPPRSPRRPNYAAAAYENPAPPAYAAAAYESPPQQAPMQNAHQPTIPTVPYTPVQGVRQGPDMYTQDGRTVCGRCHKLGCSRINCRRQRYTCSNCKKQGHIAAECETPPRNQGNNGGGQGQFRRQGNGGGMRACFGCGKTDHYTADCPAVKSFRQMMAQSAQANAPASGTQLAQQ